MPSDRLWSHGEMSLKDETFWRWLIGSILTRFCLLSALQRTLVSDLKQTQVNPGFWEKRA